MKKGLISFLLIYTITYPLRALPYPALHFLGRRLGTLLYYLSPKFRKRTLSNLKLASIAQSKEQLIALSKASLQSLMITCLEYAKLDSEKKISKIATCVNPKRAEELMRDGTPPIFFCGHQANWELLFLEGTTRMQGTAIGRPIKNSFLYNWVLSIREKFGGRMVSPKQAVKEGLRALKQGRFLGIVGDQGMPDSGFSSDFLGKKAWTSPLPALLSHRTGSPLIVATTKRVQGRYLIHYSDPIWPQKQVSLEQEVPRLMQECLTLFEKSVQETPQDWLWSHNRWKQQTPDKLKKPFRHETLLVILPKLGLPYVEALKTLKDIYPHEFITVYAHNSYANTLPPLFEEIKPYADESELFQEDFRFKLLFNFTKNKSLSAHFKRLSVFTTICLEDIPKSPLPFEERLKSHLMKDHAP